MQRRTSENRWIKVYRNNAPTLSCTHVVKNITINLKDEKDGSVVEHAI